METFSSGMTRMPLFMRSAAVRRAVWIAARLRLSVTPATRLVPRPRPSARKNLTQRRRTRRRLLKNISGNLSGRSRPERPVWPERRTLPNCRTLRPPSGPDTAVATRWANCGSLPPGIFRANAFGSTSWSRRISTTLIRRPRLCTALPTTLWA